MRYYKELSWQKPDSNQACRLHGWPPSGAHTRSCFRGVGSPSLLESVPAELNRLLNEKGGCLLEPDRNPLVGSVWMRDLTEHFERRNALETILRYIPGFHGYLEKEYRRDADALQRQWLADQLQQAKRPLDDLGRTWLERGQLDQLGQIDLLRSRLDQLIGRIRGAMRGYSGFFDLVRIDQNVLDRVYAHDASLVQQVAEFREQIEKLPRQPEQAAGHLPSILEQLDRLAQLWSLREEILRGLV